MCASSSLDSSMRIWDLESGEKISTIDVGPVDLWTVAFSPDDKYVISGSHAGKINLYNVETGKAEHSLDTRGKFTLSIAYVGIHFYDNNKYVLAGDVSYFTFFIIESCWLSL